jgi:hypothetical protein
MFLVLKSFFKNSMSSKLMLMEMQEAESVEVAVEMWSPEHQNISPDYFFSGDKSFFENK